MIILRNKHNNLFENQSGFASLVIALILILVLSLLTVGFATLMNHETRSALDKQLASQAYYAAESGVNDAATAIANDPTVRKSSCAPTTGVTSLFPNNKVGNTTGASYPCLLINPSPTDLEYSIGTQQSKITQLQGVDDAGTPKAISSILIGWEDKGHDSKFAPSTNCNGGTTGTFLPTTGSPPTWSYTGILKTQLIPINDLSRDGLTNNTFTAFLCPQSGGGTPTPTAYSDSKGVNGGSVISGECNSTAKPRFCSIKITGLAPLNQSTFMLAMRSIYSATNVTIKVYGADAANTQLNIAQAQILVDSTGKAQDVLKRVQVRIPAHNGYAIPDGAAAMNSICKQLQVVPSPLDDSARGGVDCTP